MTYKKNNEFKVLFKLLPRYSKKERQNSTGVKFDQEINQFPAQKSVRQGGIIFQNFSMIF